MRSGSRGRGLRRGRRNQRQLFSNAQAGKCDEPGDGGRVEACGVELDAQRVGLAVKRERTDAVDVGYTGEREGDLLGERGRIAIEKVDRGHTQRIAADAENSRCAEDSFARRISEASQERTGVPHRTWALPAPLHVHDRRALAAVGAVDARLAFRSEGDGEVPQLAPVARLPHGKRERVALEPRMHEGVRFAGGNIGVPVSVPFDHVEDERSAELAGVARQGERRARLTIERALPDADPG
jgi:hypothetical protein